VQQLPPSRTGRPPTSTSHVGEVALKQYQARRAAKEPDSGQAATARQPDVSRREKTDSADLGTEDTKSHARDVESQVETLDAALPWMTCTCKSMFVDPVRRTLAVAWSFKYQSPFGANPELQDGIALRKPGPHHTALVLAYRPRL